MISRVYGLGFRVAGPRAFGLGFEVHGRGLKGCSFRLQGLGSAYIVTSCVCFGV